MFAFSVYDLLAQNLPANADRTAVIEQGRDIHYRELAEKVDALATALVRCGVRPADRVGIHLQKSVDEIIATFAISKVGAVFVNVNLQWTPRQVEHVIRDSGIRVMCTDARRAKALAKDGVNDVLERLIVSGRLPDGSKYCAWPDSESTNVEPYRGKDTNLAALIYTSGSTGRPKGVMLSHLNIVSGARSVASYLSNTKDDRVLGLMPMSFDYGMSQVTTMFLVGGCVVLQPVPMANEIIKTIENAAVTGFGAVPPVWVDVIAHLQKERAPVDTLRYVTNTGGKIPDTFLQMMPAMFPETEIFLMYGLTEAFRSTYLEPALFSSKMGSIGKAIPNAEIYVVDPDRGLCAPGETGELLHAGSLVSAGYWGKPEDTASRIKPCRHLAHLIGEEKVVHSGDLVRIDEEGYLWFVSRLDALIKISGFRVSPTEVEDEVLSSPLINEAVAFGVEHDSLGQAIHLAVGWSNADDADGTAVLEYAKKRLPRYMVPEKVYGWYGAMPRTSNGKIDRKKIIDECLDQVGDSPMRTWNIN